MSDRNFVPILPNGENGDENDESERLKIRHFRYSAAEGSAAADVEGKVGGGGIQIGSVAPDAKAIWLSEKAP
jgi:hypothetical protein